MLVVQTDSEAKTLDLGKKLAGLLKAGDVICLSGDLGSGKTVFVRGIARGLEVEAEVTSPTFSILNVYQAIVPVYHFDLYRLENPEELFDIGFDEYVGTDGIALIEWADKFPGNIPDEYLMVEISTKSEHSRCVNFVPYGSRYQKICKELKKIC